MKKIINNHLQKFLFLFLLIIVISIFYFSLTFARSTTKTWFVEETQTIFAKFSGEQCIDSFETKQLKVNVYYSNNNQPNADSNVIATIISPNNDANIVQFTNQNDGNYILNYYFDKVGTYTLLIQATDLNTNQSSNIKHYIFVKNYSIHISFVNDNAEYSPGETIVIRNYVTNHDGNFFEKINGIINIYYPNNSALYTNQILNYIGNGEYSFSFIAPNQSGEYQIVSFFTCGSKFNSSNGKIQIKNQQNNAQPNNPEQMPTTTTFGPTIEKAELKKVALRDVNIQPFEIGLENTISLVISNGNPLNQKFLIRTIISIGNKVDYYNEEITNIINAGKTQKIELSKKWIPQYAGGYVISIEILSEDKKTTYEKIVLKKNIEGIFRYDVITDCSNKLAYAGKNYEVKVKYLNLGDYFEDTIISTWIEDEKNQKYAVQEYPIAIYPNQEIEKKFNIIVPEYLKSGKYTLKAKVGFNEKEEKISSCEITIKSNYEYYIDTLKKFEEEKEELKVKISELKNNELKLILEKKIENLNTKITALKEKIERNDFFGIEEKFLEIKSEIDEIEHFIQTISKQDKWNFEELLQKINLLDLIIFALLSILIILIIIASEKRILRHLKNVYELVILKKSNIKEKINKIIDKLLGLED
ncbi:MAG: hypothetical protein QXT97_03995 [Candidatus Diapherotrites archaeon]